MTFDEKEAIFYLASRLINELADVDDTDFVDEVTNAILNGDIDTMESMMNDLYGQENDD